MNKLLQRYLYFMLGVVIISFGSVFITKSALGTSQISSIPYVSSLFFEHISFGMATFIFNMIFIVLQLAILRKNFPPVQCFQVLVNIIFSMCIDFSMSMLQWLQPEHMIARIACLLIGCVILGVGISIEVAPGVLVIPAEGIVRVIAEVVKQEFGKVKVYFDICLIIIAVLLSFVFFQSLRGVGVGTIISSFMVGKIVSLVNIHVPFIKKIKALEMEEKKFHYQTGNNKTDQGVKAVKF